MASSLTHSAAALDALRFFHQVTFVIFVEGSEDLPFWNTIFRHFGLESYHLKVAGGSEEVEKYCRAIIDSGIRIAVARDADMSTVLGIAYDHPRILYTFGYSIENSLCTAGAIARTLQHLSLSLDDYSVRAQEWLEGVATAFLPLIELDLANERLKRGLRMPLSNFQRFTVSANRADAIAERIGEAVRILQRNVSDEETHEAATLLAAAARPTLAQLRGHFLLTGVAIFLRQHVRAQRGRHVTVSSEALFALLVGQFRVAELPAAEIQHFEGQVRRLVAAA